MTNDEITLTARWVFPVASPPLERGVVTVRNGRIIEVRPHDNLTADVDLGDTALVPGFVNAHTHLDLTGAAGTTPPSTDFISWLRRVIAYRRGRTVDEVTSDVAIGIANSLRYGTTLVGDIAAEGITWDQLSAAPIRAVVFREVIGLNEERAAASWEGFEWWRRALEPTQTCRPGVSPHAPYSVAESLLEQAVAAGLPLTSHVAETQAELDLLSDQQGPFVPFLQELGVWQPESLVKDVRRFLQPGNGFRPNLSVHCNYLPAETPISSFGTVVYCPRTHAAFGHPPHPFREFLARGVRVALGTDSLASNPDLSLLAEARFVRSQHPDLSGDVLLRMATSNGANALGWECDTGSIQRWKSADFAVVGLPNRDVADPHELLFDSDLPVVATWFRGREVYK
jgi:aminodeoxyfutalosine deaminase